MKLFIYADPHVSAYSSIVRSRGSKYSTRLENLIETLNWVESSALEESCDEIVCLGDFFDKSDLNSEEITALGEIRWSTIPHTFLVGNHEMGRSTLEFSSSHLFELIPKCKVIDKPYLLNWRDITFVYLPYILESDRKPLAEYFDSHMRDNIIIFSHNDIAGIQMGKFISQEGFSIEEIENNCRLFINGHLHNGTCIGKNIINLGNITGQNFSEDASLYRHNALILDTSDMSVKWIENPYALNFYKQDMTTYTPEVDDDAAYNLLKGLGPKAVLTLKIRPDEKIFYEDMVSNLDNIIAYRILLDIEAQIPGEVINEKPSSIALDHLSKFSDYVKETIGTDSLVLEELEKVLE